MREIYISTDIEADGPIPGEYSMLSLGSVALNEDGKVLGKFYRKLKRLEGAKQHPKNMAFWKENPEAYKEATSEQEKPSKVIGEYIKWLNRLKEDYDAETIFVGWPLTFDYTFVYWYMIKFGVFENSDIIKEVPFSFNKGIDFNTFTMAHLGKSFFESKGKNIPERWFKDLPVKHNHKAVDDAEYQGRVFIRALKENQGRK